jgi:hypothetical protein
MTQKGKLFIVGGVGCIAPNIINYASHLMIGGSLPENLAGLLLGGVLFFGIAGFLVAYILDAVDIRDAFYKGVAVPALIISLANGVSAEKSKVPVVQTVPVNSSSIELPAQEVNSFLAWWLPSPAFAQASAVQGTVEFDITPKSTNNISVQISTRDGIVVARARSDSPTFKLSFPEGEYVIAIESNDYYKEVSAKITGNQTTALKVALEDKGIVKKFNGGVKSLMSR